MIQPGGAMALFVLRLAGLLSLEKSLENNSTSQDFDSLIYQQNISNLFSGNESLFFPPNSSDFLNNWNSSDFSSLNSEKPSFLKSGNERLFVSNSSEEIFDNYSGTETSTVTTVYGSANLYELPVNVTKFPEIDEEIDKSSKEIFRFRKIGRGTFDSIFKTSPTTSVPVRNFNTGFLPVLVKPPTTSASVDSTESVFPFDIDGKHFKFKPTEINLSLFGLTPENQTSPDLQHNTSGANQNFVSEKQNTSNANKNILHVNNNTPTESSQSTTPKSSTIPVPSVNIRTAPTVRKKGKPTKKIEGLVRLKPKSKSTKSKSKPTFTALSRRPESSTKKLHFAKNISRNFRPDESGHPEIRNNPYPYGPKILPKSTTLFNHKTTITKEPETIFPDTDILYNFDEEIINLKEIEGEQLEKEEIDLVDEIVDERADEIDEFTYQPLTSSTEQNILVKTDKPAVLFHFDKPGYSPKLPESALPPKRPPTPSDPWDCSPRCPNYSLLDWNPDYDVRQYPESTWISTVIIAENRIFAELEGYMRVQDYFYGLNDRGQLINLTIPFITQIKHAQHPGVLKELNDFSVSLYINHLDESLNSELPTPISNEVLVDHLESKVVFVSGFEANVWDVTEAFLEAKALTLMEKLRQNGEAFLDRYYYLASYGRPELYQPVYYELWVYSTSFRDSTVLSAPVVPRRRPPPSELTARVKSKLCRGVECPSFEVMRTYKYGIQKRRYFDGLFVTTSPGVCEFSTVSVWKGFMPLHLYKHGINSHLEVIEATRPIGLVHVKEDSTPNTECPQNMTMAIYLPKRLHSNPPLTGYDAPPVSISALQDVVVYAYTVGGYLLEPHRVRKELSDLKFRLTEFGACFRDDEYYVAVYDFIMRYHGRQNEIWIVAENCKATVNG